MTLAYPDRRMLPSWLRYLLMAFGVACCIGPYLGPDGVMVPDVVIIFGGIVVGAAWFAFGMYGGLPLLKTASEWHPPALPDEVTSLHREGLLVLRRRRWMMCAAFTAMFTILPFMAILLMPSDGAMYFIAGVWLLLVIIIYRYLLSRCPRCGYGFFATSTHRAAPLWFRTRCGHCDLLLSAYKHRG